MHSSEPTAGSLGKVSTDSDKVLCFCSPSPISGASQMALVVKNLPANAGDPGDAGSIPGLGRSLGEWNGNPLQYSCLENPGRGAWRATVHRVGHEESDMTEAT